MFGLRTLVTSTESGPSEVTRISKSNRSDYFNSNKKKKLTNTKFKLNTISDDKLNLLLLLLWFSTWLYSTMNLWIFAFMILSIECRLDLRPSSTSVTQRHTSPPKITLLSHMLIGDTIDIATDSTIRLRCTGQRPLMWIFPNNNIPVSFNSKLLKF